MIFYKITNVSRKRTQKIYFYFCFMQNEPHLKIVKCDDGSSTLYRPDLDEHYHSVFGALTESKHIFINAGFDYLSRKKSKIHVFEVGFGTGLNALLTALEAQTRNIEVLYTSLEPIVLNESVIKELQFEAVFSEKEMHVFEKIHQAEWNKEVAVLEKFNLHKLEQEIENFQEQPEVYDLVYFDAFAPGVQPELWTTEIFTEIYGWMKKGSVLVTYSCKGDVKRACKSAGFSIEKLPGPKGKREFLRCIK